MPDTDIRPIIEILEELKTDASVPRNVKEKIENTLGALKDKCDLKLRINKALHELDEIADDVNLQSYTRTQIWNVVSLLEKLT
ncbi:UPF0147 family protein [Candidatus Woesearchaeota archaeon]|nr:UPF0147 family protein [Candidatus Woesearchaeota archaeon]